MSARSALHLALVGLLLCAAAPVLAEGPAAGPTPEGLDKAVVRRVIRAHIGEVRYCYERGMAGRPALEGRVLIRFTIGPDGGVVRSGVAGSTMNAPEVEECIALAVRRWRFPAPSGPVVITYPFVLRTVLPAASSSRRGPGQLTEEDIRAYVAWVAARRVVLGHQQEVDRCFSQEIDRDATLRSMELMVPVSFSIDADGSITRAEVERVDAALAGVGACLVGRLKTWRFPPTESRGPEHLSYVFLFGAGAVKPIEGVDHLAPGAIRGVLRSHQREIEGCAPVKNAAAAALIVPLKFTVNPDGSVADAALSSQDAGTAEVASCLIKRLRTWRFPPPPSGGAEVVLHPFEL